MSLSSSAPDVYKDNPSIRISWRAVLFALVAIPLNVYWIAITEMVWSSLHFTSASLPLNVIFILCCLLLYNAIVRRMHPGLVFSEGDLLVIYIILATSSAIAGYDSLIGLMGTLAHTTWFATPENDWAALFGRYLPEWFIIADQNIVRDFYLGEADFFEGGYWRGWLTPALNWAAFILLLVVLLLCITVILRRPWTEQEKLTYPIIQLPLEMSNPATRLFNNRLMWMGFALAAAVDIINGLHYLYPSVPHIPIREGNLGPYFTTKPWNAIGSTWLRLRFFMLGMTYLLPHQLEAFKIAERSGLPSRGIFWLLLLASVVGLVSAFIIFPATLYYYGAETRAEGMKEVGWGTFNRLASWLQVPRSPDWVSSGFLFGGMLLTFVLTFLRYHFIWWPLHPAGYILAVSDSVGDYWFAIFVASTIKWLVLRHGGARAYRRSVPFFLGLILGDYLLACGWALLGVLLERSMYSVWV